MPKSMGPNLGKRKIFSHKFCIFVSLLPELINHHVYLILIFNIQIFDKDICNVNLIVALIIGDSQTEANINMITMLYDRQKNLIS